MASEPLCQTFKWRTNRGCFRSRCRRLFAGVASVSRVVPALLWVARVQCFPQELRGCRRGRSCHATRRLPGLLSIGFPGVDGDVLLHLLQGLAISQGSACSSGSFGPSHVLRAMETPVVDAAP